MEPESEIVKKSPGIGIKVGIREFGLRIRIGDFESGHLWVLCWDKKRLVEFESEWN